MLALQIEPAAAMSLIPPLLDLRRRLGCACLAGALLLAVPANAAVSATRDRPPRLFPDYAGITLPPNIAPLNFVVREPGRAFRLELRSPHADPIRLSSSDGVFRFSPGTWDRLLRANAGQSVTLDISVKNPAGAWDPFQTVTNHVAPEEIEGHLSYRLLKPLYNLYVNIGIYQRDLHTFEERPILENHRFNRGCVNCHTPLNRSPENFALNIRTGDKLNPMLLVRSNQIARVDKTLGYLAWHPSGRLLAFSANKLSMFAHTRGETRDVFDAESNLAIYRVDSNELVSPPAISATNRNETWPAWSPDGRHLYFSAAQPMSKDKYRQVRYDLVRVEYDFERDKWGEPEILVASAQSGLSACQPKVSPDSKSVLFTMCPYGNFPIYQESSDLYLLDVATRKYQRLDINSDQADSWHCWSANGRWIVFSSKRLDGLFARPHFSYLDASGRFHKPFILPQEDPTFYESYIKTFNLPELVNGPVTIKESELAGAILHPKTALQPSARAAESGKAPIADQGEGELYRRPTQ